MTSVLAVNCSPAPGGRTRTALEEVLAGVRERGAAATLVELSREDGTLDVDTAVAALHEADAFVLGSPMYRASYAAPFKALLDRTPRGMWGEATAPLTARAVATVATAADAHHFLGPAAMRDVLVDFFAAHVLSPGVYLATADFDEAKRLLPESAARARAQGRALVDLAAAVAASPDLSGVRPQA